jgi:Mce-associated membrane protein
MPPRDFSTRVLETGSPTSLAASETEAAELSQIEAHAEAARARATQLRQQAEAASSDQGVGVTLDEEFEKEAAQSGAKSRRWRRRRSRKAVLITVAGLLVICGSLATTGLVVWHHHDVAQQRQRSAEFATIARDGVAAMMSISADKARDDIQRFVDRTMGTFKASVLMGANDVISDLEKSKVSSKAAVQAVAVQSMTKDSAVVLVAAKSEITKPDQTKPQSRSWRVAVTIERDGGQFKISKVEFVP